MVRIHNDSLIRTAPVHHFNEHVQTVIRELLQTVKYISSDYLAAPQLNYPIAIAVVDGRILVNPVISDCAGTVFANEVCNCTPNEQKSTRRHLSIVVQYQDSTGRPQTLKASGIDATHIQHALDHLNGLPP